MNGAEPVKSNWDEDGDEGMGTAPDPRRVRWHMVYRDGSEEWVFEPRLAMAALLIADEVFLNSRHWKSADKDDVIVLANCSDVFAWGCSDAEEVDYRGIESLYDDWRKDPVWGTAVWCMRKRGEMPQAPVAARIRESGIWDIDAMGLAPNRYDEACRRMAVARTEHIAVWENEGGSIYES